MVFACVAVVLVGASCRENRCADSQRSLFDDSQPHKGCPTDTLKFYPSHVRLGYYGSDELSGSGGAGSGGTASGGSATGSESPSLGQTTDEAVVTLVVQDPRGWRRDHVNVGFYLSQDECPSGSESTSEESSSGQTGGASAGKEDGGASSTSSNLVSLVAVDDSCEVDDERLKCVTDTEGEARFKLRRIEGRSGEAYLCPLAESGDSLLDSVDLAQELRITVISRLDEVSSVSLESVSSFGVESWSCETPECATGQRTVIEHVSLVQEAGDGGASGEDTSVEIPMGLRARVTILAPAQGVSIAETDRGRGCPNRAADGRDVTSVELDLSQTGGDITFCVENPGLGQELEYRVTLQSAKSLSDTRMIDLLPEKIFVQLSASDSDDSLLDVDLVDCTGQSVAHLDLGELPEGVIESTASQDGPSHTLRLDEKSGKASLPTGPEYRHRLVLARETESCPIMGIGGGTN